MSATHPRFHRLAVNDLRRESADAVSLTFAIPHELADDYHFAPGQYLTLRTTMDGEEVRRSYSICSGPDDGELRIAVKKVDGGAFSSWAADELKAGDELDVMTPTGRFGIAPPQAGSGRRALFGVQQVACPQCGSEDTEVLSEFGSTSCKALWRCRSCREPFDYFKCH